MWASRCWREAAPRSRRLKRGQKMEKYISSLVINYRFRESTSNPTWWYKTFTIELQPYLLREIWHFSRSRSSWYLGIEFSRWLHPFFVQKCSEGVELSTLIDTTISELKTVRRLVRDFTYWYSTGTNICTHRWTRSCTNHILQPCDHIYQRFHTSMESSNRNNWLQRMVQSLSGYSQPYSRLFFPSTIS